MGYLILLAILIYVIRNSKHPVQRNKKALHKAKRHEPEWHSEWVWDEEKQLWVHPLSRDSVSSQDGKEKDNDINNLDYANAYQARCLLTKNEWNQYEKLKEIADIKGYVICPKVRLFDIIEPKKGHEKYKTLMYKIQAKHVDFVICDKGMRIKVIIELDDSSHDKRDRKERDEFVDLILRSVGYKVVHTRNITNDILDLV